MVAKCKFKFESVKCNFFGRKTIVLMKTSPEGFPALPQLDTVSKRIKKYMRNPQNAIFYLGYPPLNTYRFLIGFFLVKCGG